MPGRPLKRVQCARCQDWVQDKRDLLVKGEILCKQCAEGRYYIEL
jgi:formylmethanofuran dehydrogenase subunit E